MRSSTKTKHFTRRLLNQAERDETRDSEPHAIDSFGANENGALDLAGNVGEWTDTCFVHQT
jgi:formylglycine-generating enzyme required for sulfatase activity